MSNDREDAFNQWWNGIENFATRAERLDGESPESIAKAAFFAALSASKTEPQKPGVWDCTFKHRTDIGVVVTSEDSKPETQAQGRMCSCIECVPDQPEPQAQATNEHTEREELINWLWMFSNSSYVNSLHNVPSNLCRAANMLAADKAGGEVAQWQKRHPDIAGGCWTSTNEADAKWWRDNAPGWEARALYTCPQPVPDDVVKDAERLDWIARQGDEFTSYILVDCPGDGNYYVSGAYVSGEGKTFRAAIDAAMLKEEK